MDHVTERLEAGYTLEQLVEIADVTSDEDSWWEAINDSDGTPWESFINEIDAWARQALAANGFGDY